MSSSLTAFLEGTCGATHYQHDPIPHAGEKPWEPAPVRVIVQGGSFTEAATAEDKTRLAGKLGRIPDTPQGKAPVVVFVNMHKFVCRTCGLPGESPNSKTITHPGECRRLDNNKRAAKLQAQTLAARRAHRSKHEHLRPEIARLRAEGVSWTGIGARLGINPETARTVLAPRGKALPPDLGGKAEALSA